MKGSGSRFSGESGEAVQIVELSSEKYRQELKYSLHYLRMGLHGLWEEKLGATQNMNKRKYSFLLDPQVH